MIDLEAEELDMEKKKVFIFAFLDDQTEKNSLHRIITNLGGIARKNESMYVSDMTHIIMPNRDLWCPKVFGAVASKKHVVTPSYILDSEKAGKFLDEKNYYPTHIAPVASAINNSSPIFANQTCVVLLKNSRRQTELRLVLRDAGATVPPFSVDDLMLKPDRLTKPIKTIYTDMSCVDAAHFKSFVNKRANELKPVRVLSYYAIFKTILSCPKNETERLILEEQFNYKNTDMMKQLHPRSPVKQSTSTSIREGKNTVYTVDSSDDNDDEIEVISTKPAVPVKPSTTNSTIVPGAKRKRWNGQIEHLGKDYKPLAKKPTFVNEVIDLADSDDDIIELTPPSSKPGPKAENVDVTKSEESASKPETKSENNEIRKSQVSVSNSQPVKNDPPKEKVTNGASSKPPTQDKSVGLESCWNLVPSEGQNITQPISSRPLFKTFGAPQESYAFSIPSDVCQEDQTSESEIDDDESKEDEAKEDEAKEESEKEPAESMETSVKSPEQSEPMDTNDKRPRKMMQEIDMFQKENEDDDTASDEDNEVADEPFDELETPTIENFSSAELTMEMAKEYFAHFKQFQRDQLQGMDVCDEMEKRSPKFDVHKESSLQKRWQKYFDKQNNIVAKGFTDSELNVLGFSSDDESVKISTLFYQLTLYRSILSARHFLPASALFDLYTDIRKGDGDHEKNPTLTRICEEKFMEILNRQLLLHPINSPDKRKYYETLFDNNIPNFVHGIYANKKRDTFDMDMLHFVVEVLKKDTFQWRKHDKHDKSRIPLIGAFKGQNGDRLIEDIGNCKNDPIMHQQLSKILAFAAVYGQLTQTKHENQRLKSKDGFMQILAVRYFRKGLPEVVKSNFEETFSHTYLLRPSWLSLLVQLKLVKHNINENQPIIAIDDRLKGLLKYLPGSSTLDSLPKSSPEFTMMLLTSFFQTLPINIISRLVLREKNALQHKVKFKPSKLKSKIQLYDDFTFDNNVALKKDSFHDSLKQCIDLLSELQLKTSEEDPQILWHFI